MIDAFRGLNAHILVQEYIKEAQGCDIRCLVVGDEVVAAIERRAKEGDFSFQFASRRRGKRRQYHTTGA